MLGLLLYPLGASVLLIPAGRLNWWPAYACTGLFLITLLGVNRRLQQRNPDLFARRSRDGSGVPLADVWLVRCLKLSVLAIFACAGWQSGRPNRVASWPEIVAGLALFSAGWSLLAASFQSNPFFEGMVRLQSESGHRVVQEGAYARIRHPGYLGFLLLLASPALLLASTWSGAAWLLFTALLLLRIGLEERFLKQHLEGYDAYTRRVRHRLIPGVW